MHFEGLTAAQVEERRRLHGSNALTRIEPDPLWKKILHGFTDPMIMILLVALVIQVALYFAGQAEWFEPVGILVAILIANGVASISENQQENKAVGLREDAAAKELTKVIRDGQLAEIPVADIVVGDIVFLQAGDRLPADGELCHGEVMLDQAVLNGETEEILKFPPDPGKAPGSYDKNDLLNSCYCYRGTVVCSGEAYEKIDVVGDKTIFGRLALEAQEAARRTPLQVKLDKLAQQISAFGYIGAIAIIIGILARTFITGDTPQGFYPWVRLLVDAVTVAVTVIVCAVPEGLPMLTSILLSAQSIRMEKDNVLVKKINGIETSGSLSMLFSDKTGTITEGKLSVVEITSGNGKTRHSLTKAAASSPDTVGYDANTDLGLVSNTYIEAFVDGIGLNNSAHASNGSIIGGNSTDRALIGYLMCEELVDRLDRDRIKHYSAFNSKDKFSYVLVQKSDAAAAANMPDYGNTDEVSASMGAGTAGINCKKADVRTYIKGAPELMLPQVKDYLSFDGSINAFTDTARAVLAEHIEKQASRSMRLLAVAMAKGNEPQGDLTLIGIISIRDNLRPEAVTAIHEVQQAGIQVVMVTGDKRETAVAIATESGLISSEKDVVLTSKEMGAMSDAELKTVLPKVRVVARALPTDKSRLVRIAQEMDYVVGMTGDGVNDSPALKKADVGFAMGSGTEVAKESGDITILDDNFSSIAKAILYGRSMFKSIRKFLIFQLTVNVAAVLVCFLGPMLGENVVLTVIQLLLINLAMDTLAAIAFGSEPALKEFMLEKPVPRRESIVTKKMLTQVVCCSLYITVICLSIMFLPFFQELFGGVDKIYMKSSLFATFMMAIMFNGFNARTEHMNIFEHITQNKTFLAVCAAIFGMQLVFVELGGEVLSVEPLSLKTWSICGILAALVIPVDLIRKTITKNKR